HIYQSQVQEGLITGGTARLTFNESYLSQNAPSNLLNPSELPTASLRIQHNFLNGFGRSVNSRFIRVAEKNRVAANVTFRSQLDVLVQNVVNLYWDMSASGDDLRARRLALQISQKFLEDTQRQINLGAVAKVDIFRAQSDFSSRQQDVA